MIDMMLQQESNNIVTMPLAGHRSGGWDDLLSVFYKKGIERHHGTNFPLKPLRSFMRTKENPSHTRLKETKVRALELEQWLPVASGFPTRRCGKINSVQVELNRQRTLTATKERIFSNWSVKSRDGLMETHLNLLIDTTFFAETTCCPTCCEVLCDMEKKGYRKCCECGGSTVAVRHCQALASRESSPFRGHNLSMLSYLYRTESKHVLKCAKM